MASAKALELASARAAGRALVRDLEAEPVDVCIVRAAVAVAERRERRQMHDCIGLEFCKGSVKRRGVGDAPPHQLAGRHGVFMAGGKIVK